MNYKQKLILLFLCLVLLGAVSLIHGSSVDGKTLSKSWTGATDSVHNIVITVGGVQVWNTANLPSNKTMSFTPIVHGTGYTITWTDVWGSHTESGTVDCDDDGVDRVVNTIKEPKSMPFTGTLYGQSTKFMVIEI
jgi:hypothetical protein